MAHRALLITGSHDTLRTPALTRCCSSSSCGLDPSEAAAEALEAALTGLEAAEAATKRKQTANTTKVLTLYTYI